MRDWRVDGPVSRSDELCCAKPCQCWKLFVLPEPGICGFWPSWRLLARPGQAPPQGIFLDSGKSMVVFPKNLAGMRRRRRRELVSISWDARKMIRSTSTTRDRLKGQPPVRKQWISKNAACGTVEGGG